MKLNKCKSNDGKRRVGFKSSKIENKNNIYHIKSRNTKFDIPITHHTNLVKTYFLYNTCT
jgi:hypothetical protein